MFAKGSETFYAREPLHSLKAFIETIILGHYPQFLRFTKICCFFFHAKIFKGTLLTCKKFVNYMKIYFE